MTEPLEELVEQLSLERIEETLFRGQSQDLGWGTVFGGQVLGQSLSAAQQTVDDGKLRVHSMHAYFLRRGDVNRPIVYEVDKIRDGKSFTTRRVVAIQHGRPIFNMSASFQIDEPGHSHQDNMPGGVPGPDGLRSERELAERVKDLIPKKMRDRALGKRPIEIRPVNPQNPLKPEKGPPTRYIWFKASSELPDEPNLHQYLLAYASDFHLLGAALQPHGISWMQPNIQVASLDHAMWFHRPFRMDEWLLYQVHSHSSSGARGLSRGAFFNRAGELVATTMQEGLMRDHNLKSTPDDDGAAR